MAPRAIFTLFWWRENVCRAQCPGSLHAGVEIARSRITNITKNVRNGVRVWTEEDDIHDTKSSFNHNLGNSKMSEYHAFLP